jgi:hypothetical protein
MLALGLISGCGKKDEQIAVYRIEKPADSMSMPVMAPDMSMPSTPFASPTATAGQASKYTWDVPTEWKTVPASGMRLASFSWESSDKSLVDISVVVLNGDAGGLAANINRWRGQIGLTELSEAEVTAAIVMVDSSAGPIKTCAFSSSETLQGLAAGILMDGEDSWFFKMSGSQTAVTENQPRFTRFLESLRKSP